VVNGAPIADPYSTWNKLEELGKKRQNQKHRYQQVSLRSLCPGLVLTLLKPEALMGGGT
jgi:hypothetical protein